MATRYSGDLVMSHPEVKQCARTLANSEPKLPELLQQIMAKSSHERIVELCYWAQEPGLLNIIRAVSAMPDQAREALDSFFALVGDSQSVVAQWESSGRLVLESPQLGEALS